MYNCHHTFVPRDLSTSPKAVCDKIKIINSTLLLASDPSAYVHAQAGMPTHPAQSRRTNLKQLTPS